ncbi:MAG: hypothetical protein AAGB97_02950 [Dehalococcoidia bacterium]|nr:hypothetical protein [Chloroflexota bacterium]MBT9162878.1 hypothetical protein [Chloroflexota bacterium]
MKEIRSGLMRKGWCIFISSLILLSLSPAGCANTDTQNAFKVDSVDTASIVTLSGGQPDWRNYVSQKSFPSGYSGEFWVMFSFSNMLHDKTTRVKANIYIVSQGELKAEKNKEANITDSSDNKLWWGNRFDISNYPDGDYLVIVTMTDLIAGTSASLTTTFKVGDTR